MFAARPLCARDWSSWEGIETSAEIGLERSINMCGGSRSQQHMTRGIRIGPIRIRILSKFSGGNNNLSRNRSHEMKVGHKYGKNTEGECGT